MELTYLTKSRPKHQLNPNGKMTRFFKTKVPKLTYPTFPFQKKNHPVPTPFFPSPSPQPQSMMENQQPLLTTTISLAEK